MYVERGKCARIDEPDSRAVVELDDRPCKARRRSRCAVHDPVARHAKVRMKGAAVVEVQELMLAATFDTIDTGADERSQARRCDSGAKAAMHHPRTHNRAALGSLSQHANRSFDLGKFRHTPPSQRPRRSRREPASSKIRAAESLVRLQAICGRLAPLA